MRVRLALFAVVGLLAAGASAIWLGVMVARQNHRIALLEAELRSSRAQRAAVSAPVLAPSPSAPESIHNPENKQRETRLAPSGPQLNVEAEQLRARLQESQDALAKMQTRIDELEAKAQEFAADRTRLSSAESEARGQIADLSRRLEGVASERAGIDKRMRELEAENARMREQTAASMQHTAQLTKLVGDWQDLAQRQQVYVTNALRRYRELTDLFRRMPGMLDVKGNGPELSRIQSAVSMADEDLRQLNDLNARLGRVQKQIAAVR
jgi:chromosome segregation ATPase